MRLYDYKGLRMTKPQKRLVRVAIANARYPWKLSMETQKVKDSEERIVLFANAAGEGVKIGEDGRIF